jgi:hypothetical protein
MYRNFRTNSHIVTALVVFVFVFVAVAVAVAVVFKIV